MHTHTSNGYKQIERKGTGTGVAGGRGQGQGQGAGQGWRQEEGRENGSHYSPGHLKEMPTNITCTQTELTSRWG
jgi:hypothetical protein